MKVSNDPIPLSKFGQWDEILKATGGRYSGNPRVTGDVVRVDYEPGDYREQCLRWHAITTPIKEVRRDQFWRRLLRRIHRTVT